MLVELPKYNFYGRKIGAKLSNKSKDLLENLLPLYLLKAEDINFKEELGSLLKNYPKAVMEIGFGKGSHLAHKVKEEKATIFFGIEVFLNGVAALLNKIEEDKPQNLKIFNTNAFYVLDNFLENSLDEIYLLFPDPWPKIRHHKRRMINQENLKKFCTLLKTGGKLKFATDHKEYSDYALEVFKNQKYFMINNDFEKPWANHHPTEYQIKAQNQGINSLFFELTKI